MFSFVMYQIRVLEFFYVFFQTFSVYETLVFFRKKYNVEDIYLDLWLYRFYWLQSEKKVGKVLASKTKLPYLNKIFNTGIGLDKTINTYNTSDCEWVKLHKSFKDTVELFIKDETLMSQFVKEFEENIKNGEMNINSIISISLSKFWSRLMLGDINDANNRFEELRELLLECINFSFYNNSCRNIPIIGLITSFVYRFTRRKQMNYVKRCIEQMITECNDCFLSRLHNKLSDTELTVNNFVLSLLVYDFVHLYLTGLTINYSCLTDVEQRELNNNDNLMKTEFIKTVLTENFLFPIRGRYTEEPIYNNKDVCIKGNSYCFIDIVKSGKFFSSGWRRCVGYSLVKKLTDVYIKNVLSRYNVLRSNNTSIVRESFDTPFIKSQHYAYFYDKDYLTTTLPRIFDIDKDMYMYDVGYIYAESKLYKYIVDQMCTILRKIDFDVVVTVESRGFCLAGSIGSAMNKPVYLIKKEGKSIGKTIKVEYKRGHSPESIVMEMTRYPELNNKKAIFVDDGLSTGGTALGATTLLEKLNCEIVKYMYIVRHYYKEIDPKYYLEKSNWIFEILLRQ